MHESQPAAFTPATRALNRCVCELKDGADAPSVGHHVTQMTHRSAVKLMITVAEVETSNWGWW